LPRRAIKKLAVMETYCISALPVVDGQKLVGMISVMDLLRVFVEQNEEAAA
jgi:CBS domain-containing protein